jgi:hypothetical protein
MAEETNFKGKIVHKCMKCGRMKTKTWQTNAKVIAESIMPVVLK